MTHPDTELRHISEHIGSGIFATAYIPRGTLVYVKDELEFEFRKDDPMLSHPVYGPIIYRYSYIDPRGLLVMSWDLARFVNHCCSPNTLSSGYGFEIAIRDILPGEQITDDYGMFNIVTPMTCACGEPNCRSTICPNDFDHMHEVWDAQVKAAMGDLLDLPQPLLSLVEPSTLNEVRHYLRTGEGYRSVRELRHEPEQASAMPRARQPRRRKALSVEPALSHQAP